MAEHGSRLTAVRAPPMLRWLRRGLPLGRPPARSAEHPITDPGGRRRGAAIAVMALLGVIASAVLAAILTDADARTTEAQFAEQARDYQKAISEAADRVGDVMRVEQAYFESLHSVTRGEFLHFAKTVRKLLALGLRDTTWAPRVSLAERAGFEQAVRAEGFPGFEIRELDAAGQMVRAPDRDEYFPALFVDAGDYSTKVLGLDIAFEAERRRALMRAQKTGQPAITAGVRLVLRRPGEIATGFITLAPVYDVSRPDQAPLRGIIVGVLEPERLVEYALRGMPAARDLDAYLFDPTAPPDARLIYWHSSRARPGPVPALSEAAMRTRPHTEAILRVADRSWGILLARPAAQTGGLGGRGLATLLLGCAGTLGVAAHLTASLRHALRLEALTAQLRRTGEDLLSKGQQIAHLAQYDALTGLPNRATFRARLQSALRTACPDAPPCVMCLDLHRFKSVNDTFGHQVGDALLTLVGTRLRSAVRAEDTVARVGGDEFMVLLERLEPTTAQVLADRLQQVIGEPYAIQSHRVSIGLSIGIAFPPEGSTDDDLLMRNADFAMFRAKQDGHSKCRLFEPAMAAAAQARRTTEANLRSAVQDMAFELHFQPLIRLRDRHVCGFEALLRWNCPGRGYVSPAEFVPLAEECGLIVPIGDWALQTACREATRWPTQARVSVNLSPAQFASPRLVDTVRAAAEDSGLDPRRLELEITERLLLQDGRDVLAKLQSLKRLGASVSMDDFGTGYSSLSYLRKFPFDTLKIDQSFVRDLPVSKDCRAIVHAVTGLCRTLGITTVAEGVETEEQLLSVLAEGCDEVQGFLFSRPVPAAQVASLLARADQFAVS